MRRTLSAVATPTLPTRLDDVARVASPRALVPASWVTAVLLRRRPGAARIALGTSIAYLASELLKRAVSRRRPSWLDKNPRRSFPSGHSAVSTAYLTGLALVAPSGYRPFALGAAILGAICVDALRVGAREHWPGDVIAGDLVGVLGIATAHLAVRALREHDEARGTGMREAGTA